MRTNAINGVTFTVCLLLGLAMAQSPVAVAEEPTLSKADFEEAKTLFFQRCAGCHGVLRKGATGKNLEPENTLELGQRKLERMISLGTEGGMNNFDDILTRDEIKKLATYIQMPAPEPPELDLATMKKRWKTYIKPSAYPSRPAHGRNWENFFLVILRDAGKVAVIDGDTKEVVTRIDTGYAVHVMKESSDGRFWYTMGRGPHDQDRPVDGSTAISGRGPDRLRCTRRRGLPLR